MKFNSKIITLLSFIALILLVTQTIIIGIAPIIPVAEIESNKQIFTPSTMNGDSMYIVDPDQSHFGAVLNGEDSSLTYTDRNSGGYTNFNTNYNDGDIVSSTLTSSDSQILSNNPFMANDPLSLPRAVKIDNDDVKLSLENKEPFSLHLNQDFTFFAEANIMYYAVFNSTNGFWLDAYKREDAGSGYIMITNSTNMGRGFSAFDEQTFPVFTSSPGTNAMHIISFYSSVDSLVTFTPHSFNPNSFPRETLLPNSTYVNTFEQGYCGNLENEMLTSALKKVKTIYRVDLDVQGGTSYQLFIDTTKLGQSTTSLCQTGSITTSWLNSTSDMMTISGSLVSEKTTFYPLYNGTLELLIVADGNLNVDYLIYFRSISEEMIPAFNLPLNQFTTINNNANYFFSLSGSSMMAINYSSSNNANFNSDFDFYIPDPTLNNGWMNVADENIFSIEKNNLIVPNNNELGTNWVYMPAGEYRITPTDNFISNFNYTFNVIPVNTLDPNSGVNNKMTFQMGNYTVVAVDFDLSYSQYTGLNISTTAQNNLTTYYDLSYIYKSRVFGSGTNTFNDIGNLQTNGNWEGNPTNNTNIFRFSKWTDQYNPVILIWARFAENNTQGTVILTNFTTQLTVIVYNEGSTERDFGRFFYSASTDSKQIAINSDSHNSSSIQSHSIPFNTIPNEIYNLTISVIGNYTDTIKNVTVGSYRVHSPLNYNLEIFNSGVTTTTNTTYTESNLFLSDSSTTYIFVTLARSGGPNYRNATLLVTLTNLNIKHLNFEALKYSNFFWNTTVLPNEVPNNEMIFEIQTAGTGGDLVSNVAVPVVIIGGSGAVGIGGMYFLQRRRFI